MVSGVKKIPEFSVTLIQGPPRSGKSLLAVLLAKDDYDNGYDIKSVTMNTKFSETISPMRLINFDESLNTCVLLIDEIYGILDARRSMGVNADMSYFFFQCGKYDVKIIATAQVLRTVDCRITDANILSEIVTAHKVLNPDKTISHFEYHVVSPYNDYVVTLSRAEAERVYPLYNTKQVIMPLYVTGREICSWDDVLITFREAPTKKSFEQEVKTLNPYATGDQISSCYDWLKADKPEKAKKILNI